MLWKEIYLRWMHVCMMLFCGNSNLSSPKKKENITVRYSVFLFNSIYILTLYIYTYIHLFTDSLIWIEYDVLSWYFLLYSFALKINTLVMTQWIDFYPVRSHYPQTENTSLKCLVWKLILMRINNNNSLEIITLTCGSKWIFFTHIQMCICRSCF